MSTYEFDKVLSDYAHNRMTVEMAMGHSLQHIAKLYEAIASVNPTRSAEQAKIDALEKRVNAMQSTIERLTAFMEQVRQSQNWAQKKRAAPSQAKTDQP